MSKQHTDRDGNPVPRVEKYRNENGELVTRIYRSPDEVKLPDFDKEALDEKVTEVILKITPQRDLEKLEQHFLKKHFKGGATKVKVHNELLNISQRRVYSFIIAEAHIRGKIKVNQMTKGPFKAYARELVLNEAARAAFPALKSISDQSIYRTVKLQYSEEELNFIDQNHAMRMKFDEDYAFAMEVYPYFFPD
jgi:hypothetical protein